MKKSRVECLPSSWKLIKIKDQSMTLRRKYAAFLLLVACILVLFCLLFVYLVYHGRYVFATLLCVLLYLCTYQLGKRFSTIFFLLSTLRLLRKNDGKIGMAGFDEFLVKHLGNRNRPQVHERIKQDILKILVDEDMVAIIDDTILLKDMDIS